MREILLTVKKTEKEKLFLKIKLNMKEFLIKENLKKEK